MADLLAQEPKVSESEEGFVGGVQQAGRGLLESIPFKGEELAEKAGIPEPSTFGQRLTRRTMRNLPYALGAAATGVGAIPATLGLIGTTAAGQIAEEIGVPKEYQPVAEVFGGGVPVLGRDVAGRTMGYIQEPLETLSKKMSKAGYSVGPSARAEQGMKYGMGETPQDAINNLTKFTEEATSRAGKKTKEIDGSWIDKTGKTLGNEVKQIFFGKTFVPNQQFASDISNIVSQAEGVFGEKGNVVRTILEKNIGGKRAGGALLSRQFAAEDLRGAIMDVNAALSGAKGPQAGLLHQLKDSLEDLAAYNLTTIYGQPQLAKKYEDWRKAYNSYSTIRDVYQLEGKSGITAAGQINPKSLLDTIDRRTNGASNRNPLFENLGEFGRIFKTKDVSPPGTIKASTEFFTQSPLAKALKTVVQPYVRSKTADRMAGFQALSPLQQYGQLPPEYKDRQSGGQ